MVAKVIENQSHDGCRNQERELLSLEMIGIKERTC